VISAPVGAPRYAEASIAAMLDLLTVGDVMLDVHVPAPPPGGRLHAPVTVVAGGSAVNAALAAARLGARSCVVGAVGDDPAGKAIAETLRRTGVEARLSLTAHPTGTCVYAGDSVVADRGANAALAVPDLPPARATLVSAFLDEPAVVAALERAHGLRAVDVHGRLRRVPHVDVVLGAGIDLSAYDAEVVCSTLAERGAAAVRGGERAEAAPPLVLDASPVGAGDAFAAAFVLALADGLPLQEALERGCAAAVA
jgi:ribokinase